MVGIRNRLIHGYFDINLDILWDTVSKDLPPLIEQIQQIIPDDKVGSIRIHGDVEMQGFEDATATIKADEFVDYCNVRCLKESVDAMEKELRT